jgi:hypothetical protein
MTMLAVMTGSVGATLAMPKLAVTLVAMLALATEVTSTSAVAFATAHITVAFSAVAMFAMLSGLAEATMAVTAAAPRPTTMATFSATVTAVRVASKSTVASMTVASMTVASMTVAEPGAAEPTVTMMAPVMSGEAGLVASEATLMAAETFMMMTVERCTEGLMMAAETPMSETRMTGAHEAALMTMLGVMAMLGIACGHAAGFLTLRSFTMMRWPLWSATMGMAGPSGLAVPVFLLCFAVLAVAIFRSMMLFGFMLFGFGMTPVGRKLSMRSMVMGMTERAARPTFAGRCLRVARRSVMMMTFVGRLRTRPLGDLHLKRRTASSHCGFQGRKLFLLVIVQER